MRRKVIREYAAAKRQMGIKKGQKLEPGDLISKLNDQKVAQNKAKVEQSLTRPVKVAISGLV